MYRGSVLSGDIVSGRLFLASILPRINADIGRERLYRGSVVLGKMQTLTKKDYAFRINADVGRERLCFQNKCIH